MPRHALARRMLLALALGGSCALAALPARAVTVEVFAADFTDPAGAPVPGSLSGRLEVEDRDADGVLSVNEILSFSFTSTLAVPGLAFTADGIGFAPFAPVPPAAEAPLVGGLGWTGLGFLGIPPGGLLGGVSVLQLTPEGVDIARLGPAPALATAGAPVLSVPGSSGDRGTVNVGVAPLPGTVGLLAAGLGVVLLLGWRRRAVLGAASAR